MRAAVAECINRQRFRRKDWQLILSYLRIVKLWTYF